MQSLSNLTASQGPVQPSCDGDCDRRRHQEGYLCPSAHQACFSRCRVTHSFVVAPAAAVFRGTQPHRRQCAPHGFLQAWLLPAFQAELKLHLHCVPTFATRSGYCMTSQEGWESLTWDGTPHAARQAHHVAVAIDDGADAVQSAVNACPPVSTEGCHLHRHRAGRLPQATTAPGCRPHLVISCNWQPSSKPPGRLSAAVHKEAASPGGVALEHHFCWAAAAAPGTSLNPSKIQEAKTIEHVQSQDVMKEHTQFVGS